MCVFLCFFFKYLQGVLDTPAALKNHKSGQLVCHFKGPYRFFLCFFLYVQGDDDDG